WFAGKRVRQVRTIIRDVGESGSVATLKMLPEFIRFGGETERSFKIEQGFEERGDGSTALPARPFEESARRARQIIEEASGEALLGFLFGEQSVGEGGAEKQCCACLRNPPFDGFGGFLFIAPESLRETFAIVEAQHEVGYTFAISGGTPG